MASLPNATAVLSTGQTVSAGAGYGGDNGFGFHSAQPLSGQIRLDDTEQTHNQDKLETGKPPLPGDATIANYPKVFESPFTRYVTRALSNGTLSNDLVHFKPEDRSKTGVPLNPFWIRNDLWSMVHEANLFADAGPNWVAPQVATAHSSQDARVSRDVYMDNLEQPQFGQGASLKEETDAAPLESAAGTVSASSAAVESATQKQNEPDINPAAPGEAGSSPDTKEGKVDATSGAKINPSPDAEAQANPEVTSEPAPKKRRVRAKKGAK